MLKFGLVVLLLNTVHGQEQFHREVVNPSGPSQVILRGGALNSNGGDLQSLTAGDPGQQVEERYVVADQPQEQGIPFQTVQESPIPTSNDPNNPFTQGENGFGLRLSQAPPVSQVQQQVQQVQAAPGPQFLQQTHFIEQPAAVIDQPAPIVHHTEVNLPQLPAGQQYVDVYGRPIVLEQPPQLVQQPVATAPPQPPAPQVQVQKQAFVDEYGRELAQYQVHQQALPVAQQVVQQVETVPVAHQIQTAPVAHQVIQPATVPVIGQQVREIHEYNHPQVATVAAKKVLSHSPLTLQTYAVPAVRNVGNLAIPYAQKITVAKQAPVNIVYPPTVPAPAVVKSTHRTVVSPVKLDVPVQTVQEVHAAFPEVHQVHHAVPTVEHQVHLAPGPTHVEVHQPVQTVEHHQPVAFHHPQQLVHVEQHQPTIFAHHPQQLVHVEQQQQQAVLAHHPQQLVHFEHQPQLIAQHPNLVHVQQPVAHHLVHQPQAVVAHAPAVIQQPVATAAVVPAVAKVPVIEKTLVPEVTLIHQPVLPKALFQRHIFNVKHGSEPIVYQDLCTVYPYQKNLRACVLKKATLPELHHPDVRTINVEEAQPFPDQSVINPVPSSSPSVTVTKGLPNNIQETIRRESASARSKAKAEAAASASATEAKEADAEKEKGEKPSQPETAESRETRKSRRKKSKGSRRATEKPFELA